MGYISDSLTNAVEREYIRAEAALSDRTKQDGQHDGELILYGSVNEILELTLLVF